MFLLDTNHSFRVIESDPDVLARLHEVSGILIATSIIVQGELLFMAQRSERQADNLRRVRTFLSGIRIYPVDGDMADIYGELKADLIRHFGPKQ